MLRNNLSAKVHFLSNIICNNYIISLELMFEARLIVYLKVEIMFCKNGIIVNDKL